MTIPEPSVTQFDVGNILLGKVKLGDLSKHEYLKHHSIPKENDLIRQEVVKGAQKKKKTLVFQLSWLEKYKWLAYSCVAKGGLCKFCTLFLPVWPISGTFVSLPFTYLLKACGKDGNIADT